MKKAKKTAAILLSASLCFAVFFLWNIQSQDNSKNTIRILLDRLPLTLDSSQHLDVVARRIWPLLESKLYRVTSFNPIEEVTLSPAIPFAMNHSRPTLQFIFIQDELTRALSFERGEAEVAYTSLNIEKTEWLRKKMSASHFISAPGATLSFLGFNLKNPIFQDIEVRRHLGEALPITRWSHEKWKDWVVPLEGFNLPAFLPKDALSYFENHPLPPLNYLTTPVREGLETAILVREALQNIGLKVQIQMIEPTLFYSRLKHEDTELFSTRIIRRQETDPVKEYFQTNAEKNYFHYSSPTLDEFLKLHPQATLTDVRPWIENDLPIIPFYNWKYSLILNDRVHFPKGFVPTLDETFRFLLDLELN